MRPVLLACLVLALSALAGVDPRPARAEGTTWSEWSSATFERARREGRVIVVEVSASWCHWCHVMERETYADPRVMEQISARFLPVKVDADARPDLAERYAEYHWPATVFLTPDAKTVTAIRGYRGPEDFLRILAEVEVAAREGRELIDVAPPGGHAVATSGAEFLPGLRARLSAELAQTWDPMQGGFGFGQKYPFAPAVLHALFEARLSDDLGWRARALASLRGFEQLIDPVWGGMYQYSEGGVWTSPHFEKIASVNAGAMSAFASAYRLTRDRRWLDDAQAVRRYVSGMLRSPSGAFYTSQDADLGARDGGAPIDGHAYFALADGERRRLGMPRIDRAIYAQENGWFIDGLCELFRASGDAGVLREATTAARAILATHRDAAGGLRHGAGDGSILHLGDQAAFGRALVALADATGDAVWIEEATALADAMITRFSDRAAGGVGSVGGGFFVQTDDPTAVGVFRERIKPFEGNAMAARFLLALHAATGKAAYRGEALRAIASVSAPELSSRFGWRCAALLLAVEEATFAWAHATLVAADDDPSAGAMWTALGELDAPLLVRERVERGAASSIGTTYPSSPAPAIYICSEGRCSNPVRRAADLPAAWKAFAPR